MDETKIGSFCQSGANTLGIGRLVGIDAEVAMIEYTDLPVVDLQHRIPVPLESVKVGTLPLETRAYVPLNGYWIAGRVQGLVQDQYRIVLPGAITVDVDKAGFEVRWNRPLSDPAAALALSITGSPKFYKARLPFKKNLVRQRALVHGYSAIGSSAIALYPHQVDVAARVLSDPIMRYVLADEVGLGKTIEAGLVIRQTLLDDASATAVVGCPESLVEQWKSELRTKFFVDTLRSPLGLDRVTVVPHSRIAEAHAEFEPTLVVVDEAHQATAPLAPGYPELERVCGETRCVLLLTATPLRGNAETFLRMLHLIDSVAYPLDGLSDFERQLDERQQDAFSVLALDAGLPQAFLTSLLAEISSRHTGDADLGERISEIQASIEKGSNVAEAIDSLRMYLRETHRISRRVIRTRRGSTKGSQFPVRGRNAEFVEISNPLAGVVQAYLEELRQILDPDDPASSTLFDELVERSLGGIVPLSTYLSDLRGTSDITLAPGVGPLLNDLLAEISLDSAPGVAHIVDEVVAALLATEGKGVVATSFTEKARVLGSALRKQLGTAAVVEHLADMTADDRNRAVDRFDHSELCRVLVIDRSGEEGRNLQVARFLLHADVPMSPNRLEQRIGRADRLGGGGPVQNIVLFDPTSPYEDALVALVSDGVGVFTDSVSTLQRPLADLERTIRERILSDGPDALCLDAESLRETLDTERVRIDELEDIESSDQTVEFTADSFAELEEFEENWGEVRDAFDRFTDAGNGGVRLTRRKEVDHPEVFEYVVDPRLKNIPMMRLDRLTAIGRLLPGSRSFNRMLAVRRPDVRPVRVGDPLVDWLEEYLHVDDRGRAWAVWRQVAGLGDRAMAFFRFDFGVEFDSEPIRSELPHENGGTLNRLRRRGDAFLAPLVASVWIHDGKVVPGEFVDTYLSRPPRGSRDTAIAFRQWEFVLEQVPDWSERVGAARDRAVRAVVESRSHMDRVASATRSAEAEINRRLAVLSNSVERLPDGSRRVREAIEIEAEQDLSDVVLEGVRSPRVDLYASGCVLLASQPIPFDD